ncbi:MAG: hypothetical protein HY347_01690 [candidate division NC10 bacterium]|nr:hypothetical protein [candidate division NC10 bacterium]
MERRLPTRQEVDSYLRERRNWGRWGAEGRYEFMLITAPLKVVGGTGSPVNPIALF